MDIFKAIDEALSEAIRQGERPTALELGRAQMEYYTSSLERYTHSSVSGAETPDPPDRSPLAYHFPTANDPDNYIPIVLVDADSRLAVRTD